MRCTATILTFANLSVTLVALFAMTLIATRAVGTNSLFAALMLIGRALVNVCTERIAPIEAMLIEHSSICGDKAT